ILWLLHAVAQRNITWRRALAAATRIGVLAIGVSLWWILMLRAQGKFGADVLAYSESLQATSFTSTATEALRGMGYWLFYVRDPYAFTTTAAQTYMESAKAILLSVGIVVLCLGGLACTRWVQRRYAALLVLAGIVLAVGVHPIENSSPLMRPLAENSRSSLSLDLVRVGALPAPVEQAAERLLASVAGAPPARLDLPATAEREEEALARVAGGYDLSSMLEQLEALGPGQHLPRDFMWRGSAWMKLHPEDCARLAARFRGLPADGRRGAVTLLVATGTSQAQGVLRRLMEDAGLRADEGRPMWLSTLSYLRDPEPETLRLLAEESAAAGPGQGPATAALGAAIHAAKGESAPLATDFNSRLRSELATTGDPDRRQVLLTAMANVGRVENVADVSRHAADPQPQVRAAVANAVRQTQTAEAEELLVRLASDPDRPVQAVALQTIAGYRLDAAMLERIAGLVRSGAIGELGFPDLILLAVRARQGGSPPEAIRALLAAMAGAPIRRLEIRELVERAQAQQG
ncbi:MAG: alpha-(1-_3)-arabinofuranosyltransferase family protein, partial [Deltaproteobacteria bacterium]